MSELEGKTPDAMTDEELEAALRGEEAPQAVEEEAPKESEQPSEEESAGEPEQEQEEAEASPAPEAEQAQTNVPEKYRDKSAEELVEILKNQESYIGKLGEEKSATKRELDEIRAQIKGIENSKTSEDTQTKLRQGLEEDPAAALVDYIDNKVGSIEARRQQELQAQQAQEFELYYTEKLNSDPDFLRREDKLKAVAGMLKDYWKPEFVQSKAFVDAVDLISKAADQQHYIDEALKGYKKTKDTALEEKRNSKTESSYSQGSSAPPSNPALMSDEELEQAIKMSSK